MKFKYGTTAVWAAAVSALALGSHVRPADAEDAAIPVGAVASLPENVQPVIIRQAQQNADNMLSLLLLKIDEADRVCRLTDSQRAKLKVAAKGAVEFSMQNWIDTAGRQLANDPNEAAAQRQLQGANVMNQVPQPVPGGGVRLVPLKELVGDAQGNSFGEAVVAPAAAAGFAPAQPAAPGVGVAAAQRGGRRGGGVAVAVQNDAMLVAAQPVAVPAAQRGGRRGGAPAAALQNDVLIAVDVADNGAEPPRNNGYTVNPAALLPTAGVRGRGVAAPPEPVKIPANADQAAKDAAIREAGVRQQAFNNQQLAKAQAIEAQLQLEKQAQVLQDQQLQLQQAQQVQGVQLQQLQGLNIGAANLNANANQGQQQIVVVDDIVVNQNGVNQIVRTRRVLRVPTCDVTSVARQTIWTAAVARILSAEQQQQLAALAAERAANARVASPSGQIMSRLDEILLLDGGQRDKLTELVGKSLEQPVYKSMAQRITAATIPTLADRVARSLPMDEMTSLLSPVQFARWRQVSQAAAVQPADLRSAYQNFDVNSIELGVPARLELREPIFDVLVR